MKKLLFLAAALAATATLNAQKSDCKHDPKECSSYLPEKGDFATGVDLVGIVKFVGNSISEKPEGEAVAPFHGNLFAKYFLTDNIALRAHLGLDVRNNIERRFVPDDVRRDINPDAKVVDARKTRASNFYLGAGIEFRRGIRRVQGYAGAELLVGFGSDKTAYQYGNAMTESNPLPTSAFHWGSGPRDLELSSRVFGGGMAVFTGVDYFISRNVSLGFEFSLAGIGSTVKPYKQTTEEWDTGTNFRKEKTDEVSPKQSSFGIAPSGRANLMFYF